MPDTARGQRAALGTGSCETCSPFFAPRCGACSWILPRTAPSGLAWRAQASDPVGHLRGSSDPAVTAVTVAAMGKRQRRRARSAGPPVPEPVATTEYRDSEGNVLVLRDSVSAATLRKLREPAGPAAASADDLWRRRSEMLFERL